MRAGLGQINALSAAAVTLSQPEDPSSRVPRRRSRTKLSSPWEGPFIVSRVLGNGAYYLIDAQEPRKNKADNSDKETERPWNVNHLRPFFC
jgi:hypothetical protein